VSKNWIRITKELETSNHKQPDLSLSQETKYWLELLNDGQYHETSHGNKFLLYNYKIYNAFLEPTSIKELNLSCDTIYDTAENVFGTNMTWVLRDSIGEEFTMHFGSRSTTEGIHREQALIQGIVFMKEYGQYHYGESVILARELNDLKKQKKEFFERMKYAEEELKRLKSE
jgi:hypothetical protein